VHHSCAVRSGWESAAPIAPSTSGGHHARPAPGNASCKPSPPFGRVCRGLNPGRRRAEEICAAEAGRDFGVWVVAAPMRSKLHAFDDVHASSDFMPCPMLPSLPWPRQQS